ncbi:MAG: hypothetical protein ACJ75Q_13560 [Gaiellaceae bacterium]
MIDAKSSAPSTKKNANGVAKNVVSLFAVDTAVAYQSSSPLPQDGFRLVERAGRARRTRRAKEADQRLELPQYHSLRPDIA